MAQSSLSFDDDYVRLLVGLGLQNLMLNLSGLKTGAQDVYRNAVLCPLKQTGLTGCNECGFQPTHP